jgi:polysaccharide chain length determinant protein (PEP-CTERM system associated)
MKDEQPSLQALLPVLLTEARHRLGPMILIFGVIALGALALGLAWPKRYDASVTILAQESSIITPLMEGAASPTGTKNRATIARDVIFSRAVMSQVLADAGLLKDKPTPAETDRIIDGIKARTTVNLSHGNLITIGYHDSDPKRAFEVTRDFGRLFISESLASKQRESRDAYQFIDSQVEAYRQKLTAAEENLKRYRENNIDARPGSDAAINARIGDLRSQVEAARLDLTQKRSQEASLVSQLSGESEVNAVQTTDGVYRTQLADLQAQLDKLLLNYTEEYPDVVRVRHQIDDLKRQIQANDARQHAARIAGAPMAIDGNAQFNPLYQQIKSQLTALRADIAATAARMNASQAMLNDELERAKHAAGSENAVAELTRDYDVNRDVYQDLLKRRENARVSMNLDATQQGLNFVVQDPAVLPLAPSGLRFIHFALVGMLLAVGTPLGLLFLLVRFDPRLRSAEQLQRLTGLTLLATIPYYQTPQDRRRRQMQASLYGAAALAIVAAYLVSVWINLKGVA